jgi:hypothetical protein
MSFRCRCTRARAAQISDRAASLHARVLLRNRAFSFSSVIIIITLDPRKVPGIPDSASFAFIVKSKLRNHFIDVKRKLIWMAIHFGPRSLLGFASTQTTFHLADELLERTVHCSKELIGTLVRRDACDHMTVNPDPDDDMMTQSVR